MFYQTTKLESMIRLYLKLRQKQRYNFILAEYLLKLLNRKLRSTIDREWKVNGNGCERLSK